MNSHDLLLPLVVFCTVTLFTPGPNNLMLMTSGLNFGFRKTMPHLLGVTLGFAFQVLCVGLGLGVIFTTYPILYKIIKYAGAVYMLYLAWLIARSSSIDTNSTARKNPMTFFQAVAFQWINPKAWIMAIGAVSAYAPIANYPYNMFLIAGIFGLIGFGSSGSWAGLGTVLQNFLHKPKTLRTFNIIMALLLAASLYPIFADA